MKDVSRIFGSDGAITAAYDRGNFSVVTDFVVVENMDACRDQDIREVIDGKSFCKASNVEARRFNGLFTIHNVIIEQRVKVNQKARILELKRRNHEEHCSNNLYAISIKEDTAYLLVDSLDDLFDYLQQFKKLVNASWAKKLEKSHDPLALQDDVQTNSKDPLASAMLLLARAITQNFSNPTNNRLRTSSNTRNQAIIQGDMVNIQSRNSSNTGRNTRRAYVQEKVVEGSNAQNEIGNVQRTLRTSSSGNTSTITTAVEKDIMLGISETLTYRPAASAYVLTPRANSKSDYCDPLSLWRHFSGVVVYECQIDVYELGELDLTGIPVKCEAEEAERIRSLLVLVMTRTDMLRAVKEGEMERRVQGVIRARCTSARDQEEEISLSSEWVVAPEEACTADLRDLPRCDGVDRVGVCRENSYSMRYTMLATAQRWISYSERSRSSAMEIEFEYRTLGELTIARGV
ncbi:hypothetical protein Tco_0652812 [Tanacetum coccineum]|uniref:Uncharacterized protein n=1 Tax=Tanacetum coccineum TaxID=301880 RepID=A0ABQ4WZ08_9ASTR